MYDLFYNFFTAHLIGPTSNLSSAGVSGLANTLSIVSIVLLFICLVLFIKWFFHVFSGLIK